MKLFRMILGWFYPTRCPYCGDIIGKSGECCDRCLKALPIFSKTFRMEEAEGGNTDNGFHCCAPFLYRDRAREAFIKYKFRKKRQYSRAFGISTAKCVRSQYGKLSFDLVTAVPLSSKGLKERGYDQAELLAEETARNLNLPYGRTLMKVKDHLKQHELPMQMRWKNVRGVYEALPRAAVKNKTVLLCDDIVTTGATLCACADVLIRAGAKAVYCAAYAYRERTRANG